MYGRTHSKPRLRPRPPAPSPPISEADKRWYSRRRYLAELLGLTQSTMEAMVENGVFKKSDSDEQAIGKVNRLRK
jgi:hypothetical protein